MGKIFKKGVIKLNRRKSVIWIIIFFLLFSVSGSEKFNNNDGVISVYASKEKTLIPGGNCIGVTLNTDGVLVVSLSEVESDKSKRTSPAKTAGIRPGDLIKAYNQDNVFTVEDLSSAINASKDKASSITVIRDGKNLEMQIMPVFSDSGGNYQIGAWVKDAAVGIGTITFYDPETKKFAALGHGICDSDTKNLLPINTGSIHKSAVVSVDRGQKGEPGELNGLIKNDVSKIGDITQNTPSGISGILTDASFITAEPLKVADRSQVKCGSAQILANIEGESVKSYSAEIIKISPKASSNLKGMVIEITDKDLLLKTGGIVQGMSGSPIIQDGKFVGAVTHVFVNDPTRGYGIFIENML